MDDTCHRWPSLTADPDERPIRPTAPPRRRPRLPWRALAVLLALALAAPAGLLAWWTRDLPSLDQPPAAGRQAAITLQDRDGAVLAHAGPPFGETVRIEDLPPYLIDALLATEDRRFFGHPGLDPIGLGRAAWRNLQAWSVVEGGSTITQQTAKLLFLSSERSLRRKVQEALLALALERRFSKTEILTIYLNRAYFGAGAIGIDAAARRYFGKPVAKVGRLEAALLVGLLKAPSRDNPVRDPAAALRRARQVIDNMVAAGLLSAEAGLAARAETLPVPPELPNERGVADWILEQVRGLPETWGRDVVVRTTIDAGLQHHAEDRLAALIAAEGAAKQVGQGAILVLGRDGGVRAMVGGATPGGFNRAVDARRQPGSAFKPFVFLAGVEAGLRPDSMVQDAPVRLGTWTPENYDGRYRGWVPLRTALAVSANSVAVRLLEVAGIDAVIGTARRLGIDSPLRRDATVALGSSEVSLLELTTAYGGLAEGLRVTPHGIAEVADAASGEVLYRHAAPPAAPVATPAARAAMRDMLAEVVRSGTGTAAALPGRAVAGKTGTSQDYRDAWFIGFTDDLVAGVWLGNDDNTPMRKVTGGSLPARLWHEVMTAAPEDGDLYLEIAERLARSTPPAAR